MGTGQKWSIVGKHGIHVVLVFGLLWLALFLEITEKRGGALEEGCSSRKEVPSEGFKVRFSLAILNSINSFPL